MVTGIIILVLVLLGILMKEYHGPGDYFISDKLIGTIYILFWNLLFYMILIRIRIVTLVLLVLACTCSLEFLQLTTSPILDAIRSNSVGRALIGNSFAWSDFIFYFLGSVLSLAIISCIEKRI